MAVRSSTGDQPVAPAQEDSVKRWLGVLIALVTLLVTATTFLEVEASSRAAEHTRRAKENEIASTATVTDGMLQIAYANHILRQYDELLEQAKKLEGTNKRLEASAFITAAKEIAKQSPLLAPPYTTFEESGGRQFTRSGRYEADTWVITATLLSERSAAATAIAAAWSSKSNNYKVAIIVFAVVLFLLALAAILSGCIRWLFLLVGLGLATLAFLWVALATLLPVPHIPDAALQQYAQGYGYAWQGEFDQALQAYDRALKIYPDYASALAERGRAWSQVQQPDTGKAIQDLEAAIGRGVNQYDVFWSLGYVYYLAGNYPKSIEASQRSLALNPKTCGPAFNIAIARLAMGRGEEAEKDYEAAIARCERIVREYRAAGLDAPFALWLDMGNAVMTIEVLLCETSQKYCYQNGGNLYVGKPDVQNVTKRDTVLRIGEKYRKRIKEALTALEYRNTMTVQPTGATFASLVFGNRFYDDAGEFHSWVVRERFPHRGAHIYALWDYSGAKPGMEIVWKVYRDGIERPELRDVENWELGTRGTAEKEMDSWFVLPPGRYDVELYGDGELLATGAFDVDERETLVVSAPSNVRPIAPVDVGDLVFYDDFANNDHGWWTGGSQEEEGKIQGGEYLIVTHKKDRSWRVTCQACGDPSTGLRAGLGDLYYEATARFVRGPKNYGYGLTFRGDRGMIQKYYFFVTAEGKYKIAKDVDGEYISLTDWVTSPLIRPGEANRLGVLARGSSFEFFINGQSVTRLTDTSLSKGYIGFAVAAPDLEVAFSQVRVWQVR